MKKLSIFPAITLSFLLALLVFSGCKPDPEYIYDVNQVEALPADADKTILKTEEQYISVLYANLFQKALSANELVEIKRVIESVGDKETVYEVILSSFMNQPGKIIPSDATMRADLDKFIEETYARFYVRKPTAAEKEWFRNYIQADANISPELVYMSFALSNEYQYY
ncbi:MAG: hypothetical protein H6581_28675 [Bacteroidia bacterium]|nr:hypothetical protein [Bacteroidia bacterium]